MWGGEGGTHKETVREAGGYLIAQVVDLTALLGVGGGALFLEVLDVGVEDLESWCAGGLDGVCAGCEGG